MVKGMFRSGTFRRVFRRTPGGESVLRFVRRKPAQPVCSVTKKPLQGVPRGNASEVRKLPKSSRRPARPFGGVLSSEAMRRVMIQRARK